MSKHLEEIINHEFEKPRYLHRALLRKDNLATKSGPRTRSVFNNRVLLEQIGDQTALETLGDSVVHVYILENSIKKGVKSRKDMHNNKRDHGKNLALNKIAKNKQLQNFVYWSENEDTRRIWEKEGSLVLADCFEALVGAIYLDGGMGSVRNTLNTLEFLKLYEDTPAP